MVKIVGGKSECNVKEGRFNEQESRNKTDKSAIRVDKKHHSIATHWNNVTQTHVFIVSILLFFMRRLKIKCDVTEKTNWTATKKKGLKKVHTKFMNGWKMIEAL